MGNRSATIHVIGCLSVLAIAIVLLLFVFPALVDTYLPRNTRLVGLRGEAVDFLFIALVPVVVWLVPPVVRGLARLTHHGHAVILGRSGFYVRYATHRPVRFRGTLVRALSPLAIDLVVIAEIEYFFSGVDANTFAPRLFALPLLLFLAGLLTSLLPGPWLVDALDLRLVNPANGEVVREASVFEGALGPLGALALLVSFVTLAHAVGDSYVQGLVILGLWACRMFPAVLVAVSIYRLLVEPDVLPGLITWLSAKGIPTVASLQAVLEGIRPAPPRSAEPGSAEPPPSAASGDPPH